MGAWGIEIFEDDAALDILDELNDMDEIRDFVSKVFIDALELTYLEYEDGINVLVCAALIDYKVNSIHYEILLEDYDDLLIMVNETDIESFQSYAIEALKMVISDQSELNEIWSENDDVYDKWKNNIMNLIERLS